LVPKTNALSIRPQGRCLLATGLYKPVLGQLSAAFGKPAKTSSRGCRTDPYELLQERRKKKYGLAARHRVRQTHVVARPKPLKP
jgi:hypothetical protein